MHRCLQIVEVLSLIIDFVSNQNDGSEDDEYADMLDLDFIGPSNTSTLFALSLSCRTFSEHALDALWRTQSSLGPLLRCFPSHLYEYANNQVVSTYLT